MKVKRGKKVKKILSFFNMNLGIKPPYKVLCDGTFVKAALDCKVNIAEQLPRYLGAPVTLLTTRCCQWECEQFGRLLYGTYKVLQEYRVCKCGHKTPPWESPGRTCLSGLLRPANDQHYFVATKDPTLTKALRDQGDVPVLYIDSNCITLEGPSDKCRDKADQKLQEKLEYEALDRLKREKGLVELEAVKKKKKRKGANPLSCRRSHKTGGAAARGAAAQGPGKVEKTRKKGRRRKVPDHVKAALAEG